MDWQTAEFVSQLVVHILTTPGKGYCTFYQLNDKLSSHLLLLKNRVLWRIFGEENKKMTTAHHRGSYFVMFTKYYYGDHSSGQYK